MTTFGRVPVCCAETSFASSLVVDMLYVRGSISTNSTSAPQYRAQLAEATKVIGIRPGEKLHEQMISSDDAPHTFHYGSYFKILPAIHNWSTDKGRIGDGIAVEPDFEYSSNTNSEWMTVDELTKWVEANRSSIGSI